MTVTSNARRTQLTGNTGTGPFVGGFQIVAAADIAVFKNTTELTLTSDYTVSVNGNDFSVTLTGSNNGTALISSDVLTIVGNKTIERTSDFVTGGDLLAATLNTSFDDQIVMLQQINEKLSRTLTVSESDTFTSLNIPAKDDRKGKFLQFNSTSGDPETATSGSDIATVAGVASDVTTVASVGASNLTTVATNVSSINNFSDRYTVSASTPSSPNEGDLWYDSTNNILKYYTGSTFVDTSAATNKVQVSSNDTTAGFLNGKLVAGANIGLTEGSDGGDETLTIAYTGATGGISDVVVDTTPQLGGNLDVNGNSIVSVSNGNISITPNGSGKVILDGLSHPTADGTAGQFLKTDGSANLSFANPDFTYSNIATTSGTSITFSGLTGAKQIVVVIQGVSIDTSASLRMTLGDSGGLETSGYNASCDNPSNALVENSTFFALEALNSGAAQFRNGVFNLYNPAGDGLSWEITGTSRTGSGSGPNFVAGRKTLTAAITQLSVFPSSGNFDSGNVYVGIKT